MTVFKSPEEAIKACNDACDAAWAEFAMVNKFDESKLPAPALNAAKDMFRRGYYAGARWVTNSIVKQMPAANLTKSIQ